MIRSLTVGDREALLLHLRRLNWGDRLRCLLTCPVPECQEKLEIEMNVTDLLLPPYGETAPEHELTFGQEEGAYTVVRFQLPTGADQEAAANVALTDVAGAADLLLRRCVRAVTSSNGNPADELPIRSVSPCRIGWLSWIHRPRSHCCLPVRFAVARSDAIFDTASYVMQELEAGLRHLYHEVHLLAYHYHWSATEILGMSIEKRRKFLRLLEEELTQGAVT